MYSIETYTVALLEVSASSSYRRYLEPVSPAKDLCFAQQPVAEYGNEGR